MQNGFARTAVCVRRCSSGSRLARRRRTEPRPGPRVGATLDPRATPSLAGSFLAGPFRQRLRDMDAGWPISTAAPGCAIPATSRLIAQAFHYQLAAGRKDEGFASASASCASIPTTVWRGDVLAHLRSIRDDGFSRALQLLRLDAPGAAGDLTSTGTILGAWAHHALGDTDEALRVLDRLRGAGMVRDLPRFPRRLIATGPTAGRRRWRRLEAAHRLDPNALRVGEAFARQSGAGGPAAAGEPRSCAGSRRALPTTRSWPRSAPSSPAISRSSR